MWTERLPARTLVQGNLRCGGAQQRGRYVKRASLLKMQAQVAVILTTAAKYRDCPSVTWLLSKLLAQPFEVLLGGELLFGWTCSPFPDCAVLRLVRNRFAGDSTMSRARAATPKLRASSMQLLRVAGLATRAR
jgi:hypothetical protein